MVIGLPEINQPENICEWCMMGKQSRKSFKSHLPLRESGVLGVMHSYVCGPFETSSFGGNKYFVSFIDEFVG